MSKETFNDGTIGKINEHLSWINAHKNDARYLVKTRNAGSFDVSIKGIEDRIKLIKELRK